MTQITSGPKREKHYIINQRLKYHEATAGKGVPEQSPSINTLLWSIINASSHVEPVVIFSIFIKTQTVRVIICNFELTNQDDQNTGEITEGNLLASIRLTSFFSVTGYTLSILKPHTHC